MSCFPPHCPSVETKFSLESERAAGGLLSRVADELLEDCWKERGAMALSIFVGLFMCFSQLDLRSVFISNLGCVNANAFPGLTCVRADQP